MAPLSNARADTSPPVRKILTYARDGRWPAACKARHETLAQRQKIQVFFAGPHSPWQRPTNGLIREYLAKGMNLSLISQGYLNTIAQQLNNRSRRCLDDETPLDVFLRQISNSTGGVALQIVQYKPEVEPVVMLEVGHS